MNHIKNDLECQFIIDDRVEQLRSSNPDRVSYRCPQTSSIRMLSLYTYKGCMFCGKKRVRKVYEAFERRLCKDCLYANTIEQHHLLNRYHMTEESFNHLPYTFSQIFIRHRSIGFCDLTHYWKESIEQILGRTLNDIDRELMLQQTLYVPD